MEPFMAIQFDIKKKSESLNMREEAANKMIEFYKQQIQIIEKRCKSISTVFNNFVFNLEIMI